MNPETLRHLADALDAVQRAGYEADYEMSEAIQDAEVFVLVAIAQGADAAIEAILDSRDEDDAEDECDEAAE